MKTDEADRKDKEGTELAPRSWLVVVCNKSCPMRDYTTHYFISVHLKLIIYNSCSDDIEILIGRDRKYVQNSLDAQRANEEAS